MVESSLVLFWNFSIWLLISGYKLLWLMMKVERWGETRKPGRQLPFHALIYPSKLTHHPPGIRGWGVPLRLELLALEVYHTLAFERETSNQGLHWKRVVLLARIPLNCVTCVFCQMFQMRACFLMCMITELVHMGWRRRWFPSKGRPFLKSGPYIWALPK